jgi:hypothetical protein
MSTKARAVTIVGSLYALMRNRLGLNVATPLLAQEISATASPDRPLVVSTHTPVAGWPVDHGTVADEAAMLALHTLDSTTLVTFPTFVAPGDSCLRTDDPGWRWHCISGHGTTLADWERRPLPGALSAAVDTRQAASSNLSALAAVSATGYGRSLLTLANRTALVAEAAGEDGTGWAEIADSEVPDTSIPTETTWESNGDTNGLVYLIATEFGAADWTNPHTSGAVVVTLSAGWTGLTAANMVGREATQHAYSPNAVGSYFAVDLKRTVVLTDYSLRTDDETSYKPRNWKLQGSNNVAANTTAGVEAATWTDIDVRSGDTTITHGANTWGHFVLGSTPAAYRWYRVLSTGLDSSGASNYLTAVEIELYAGSCDLAIPRARPAGSRCWLTDGEFYVPAW